MEESKVGSELHGYIVVLGFWDPHRICVFGIHVVGTDTESYNGRYQHKIIYQYENRKKVKDIEA